MDNEDVVHIYSGIILSHKKEQNNTEGPKIMILNEVSLKEKDKYDTTYMWNLNYNTQEHI